MKAKICFKTPDAVESALRSACGDAVLEEGIGVMDEAFEGAVEAKYREESEKVKDLFQYGEYVWIEVDTETREGKVIRT